MVHFDSVVHVSEDLLCSPGSILLIIEHGERVCVGVAHELTNDGTLEPGDEELNITTVNLTHH